MKDVKYKFAILIMFETQLGKISLLNDIKWQIYIFLN